jgi:hypothetical protein
MNSNDLKEKILSFYDLKDDTKYIITFQNKENLSCESDSIIIKVTNGLKTWKSDPINTNDFISSLNSTKFEINKPKVNEDVIELKIQMNTNKQQTLKIKLEPIKGLNANSNEIKDLLFQLSDKLNQYEQELEKVNNKIDIKNLTSSSSSLDKVKDDKQSIDFSLNKKNNQGMSKQRKPGMSLINPLSKRKNIPKGVKFNDEDEEDSNSSNDVPLKKSSN